MGYLILALTFALIGTVIGFIWINKEGTMGPAGITYRARGWILLTFCLASIVLIIFRMLR